MKKLKADGETILSCFLFLFGTAFFALTFTFEEYGGFGGYNISAKRMPQILGIALCVCAACNIQFSLVRAQQKTESNDKQHDTAAVMSDIVRGWLTFALMVIYVALLDSIGFLIMSVIYVFFQILLLSRKEQRSYFVTAIVAVASSATVYYLFLYGFKMILPIGILA